MRLQDLQGISWGAYSPAYKKLSAAIERIDQRLERADHNERGGE